MKILVIEDSLEIVETLSYTLALKWPEATFISASNGQLGVELARNERPDIIFLDLGLPDISGFEVLHIVRSFSDVPIILLTVRGEESHKIQGFEMGANDYIVKPFSPGELIARAKAQLRRRVTPVEASESTEKAFVKGDFRIDFISKEFIVGDRHLSLSPTQVEILHVLVDNINKVVSKQKLLETVEARQGKTDIAYVEVSVKRLKEKLESALCRPILMVQEDGQSYKFVG